MTVSVCMGIYNGEKYIEEQLLSILEQTRAAEEVILCDDNSTDNTVKLVDQFINDHHLQGSWKLYCNETNKGYPDNFYHAMSLCTGDIVFLADQDDIWHKAKIENMMKVFEQHPEAKAVCCKFGLMDAEGKDIHTVMAPTRTNGTGQLRNVSIADVFYKCEWPGMVMAYRNVWYHDVWHHNLCYCGSESEWSSLMIPHDFFICAKAAEEKGFLQLDEELAYHRRHDNNAGGEEHRFDKLLNKQRKLKEIEDYLVILNGFAEGKVLQTEEGRVALQRKLASMQGRYDALCSGKISRVIKNAWQQRREVRLATMLCDVVIVKQEGQL